MPGDKQASWKVIRNRELMGNPWEEIICIEPDSGEGVCERDGHKWA